MSEIQNSNGTVVENLAPPPMVHALKASADRDTVHFHFPAHSRGRAAPPALTQLIGTKPFFHDVTEMRDLDSFFAPKGPLLEAKKLAAELFGAKETWFLVGGTTCGIQAAVMAACSPGDTIVLPRNAHVSATTGVIFSGALPKYIVPRHNPDWDVPGGVTPLQVEYAIKESKLEGRKAAAVLVTSPTYHGVCSNLDDISRICHSHRIPLIVDEAHGAHFKFHPDMPKTVPCIINCMLFTDRERLHKCLHALQSTSPNWLLLASPDAARHQLSANRDTIFNKAVELANKAKVSIGEIPGISVLDLSGFPDDFPAMDPLRITIGVQQLGLSGFQANEILDNEHGIVLELASTKSVTLAFNQGTVSEHVNRLISGLKHLSGRFPGIGHQVQVSIPGMAPFGNPVMALNPREAFFARKMKMKLEECLGEVCGESICPYPPGIPVLVPGEVITKKALDYLLQIRSHGGFVIGAEDPLLDSVLVCKHNTSK